MNMTNRILTLLALVGSLQMLRAADITGKITLKGTPPPERVIDMSAYPQCAAMHTGPVKTTHFVVGPGGGLANVFVYIKSGLEGKSFPVPTTEPVLDQQGCEYHPYVMGVMVDQKFKILNSDDTMHNVHALPRVNAEFNFAQAVKGSVAVRSFSKPEVLIRFKCDVHPWMFAYVGVVDNPFFAVTGKDGSFTLKNLPPGKYTVAAVYPAGAFHVTQATETKEVDLSGGQNAQADFVFEPKGH
jgi:hypothetical protein